MGLKYGFYNAEYTNGEYDRTYDADDFNMVLNMLFESDGVFSNSNWVGNVRPFETLAPGVALGTADKIWVYPGVAWLHGTWSVLDEILIFPAPDAPLSAVILQVDKKNRTNQIYIKPGGNTVPVTNSPGEKLYEYRLAYIYVTNGIITKTEYCVGSGKSGDAAFGQLVGGGSSSASLDASAYTTGIKFNGTTGFELSFNDAQGLPYVNDFTITEQDGKITKITNVTAGKEIDITYG